MALKIKATPTLKGKSAERFIRLVDENENKRESKAKREALAKLASEVFKKSRIR